MVFVYCVSFFFSSCFHFIKTLWKELELLLLCGENGHYKKYKGFVSTKETLNTFSYFFFQEFINKIRAFPPSQAHNFVHVSCKFLYFIYYSFCLFYWNYVSLSFPCKFISRSVIPQIVQKKLYCFLRYLFDRWPLDCYFRMVRKLLSMVWSFVEVIL